MSEPRVTHFGYGLSNTGGWVATCEEHGITSRTVASEAAARAWRCPECHPPTSPDVSLADLRALEQAGGALVDPFREHGIWFWKFGVLEEDEVVFAQAVVSAWNALPELLVRVAAAEAERDALRTKCETLTEALVYYADPETYFGIAFFADPPCGDFFDDVEEWPFPGDTTFRNKPGKRARAALRAVLAAPVPPGPAAGGDA